MRKRGWGSRRIEPERYGHTPVPIGSLLAEALRLLGATAEILRLVQLWSSWDAVMGPELASITRPLNHARGKSRKVTVRRGRSQQAPAAPRPPDTEGNLLLLGAEDAMVMQEVQLMADEILERANAFMKMPFFAGVRVSLLQGTRSINVPQARRQHPPLEAGAPGKPFPERTAGRQKPVES